MQYKQATKGRVFIVRFDHGDDLIEEVKSIAQKEKLSFASILVLGALEKGDIVTGPKKAVIPTEPDERTFDDGREIVGFGTIVTEGSDVKMHLHGAMGREKETFLGCLRKDGKVFITIEAVITEYTGVDITREKDEKTGLNLLKFK